MLLSPVYYRAVLYTGTGSAQSITGVGFKPDFVWIKERDGTDAHFIQDSTRGSTQTLYTNATSSQFNETQGVLLLMQMDLHLVLIKE